MLGVEKKKKQHLIPHNRRGRQEPRARRRSSSTVFSLSTSSNSSSSPSSSSSFRLSLAVVYFLFAVTTTTTTALSNNNSPVALQEELGCSPTLSLLFSASTLSTTSSGGNEAFYFDPLNLATDENFARYREAELKHGRLAMLSVVILSGRYYYDGSSMSSSSSSSSSDTLLLPMMNTNTNTMPSIYKVVLEQDQWNVVDWVKFTVFCGLLESLVYVQINPKDMPGDYGWGYFGERNKGKHERALVCELENGRLAMMTMLFYLGNDIMEQQYYDDGGFHFFSDVMNKLFSATS